MTDAVSFITGRGLNDVTKLVIWPSKRILKFVVLYYQTQGNSLITVGVK